MLVREATVKYKVSRRTDLSVVRSAQDVADLVRPWIAGESREHLYVILLDGKHKYLCHELVSLGTLDSCLVHPREVFRLAVREQASAIILVHNHPSGDTYPSAEDKSVCRRIVNAGEILGIELLDFVVVTEDSHISFRDMEEMGK